MKPIGLDFETKPIQLRPDYPPKPVGFSLRLPEWRASRYYAWAHPLGGNNCTQEDAQRLLRAVYKEVREDRPLVCFNSKFDLDVAEVHMDCPLPDWRHVHDPMYMLFLTDPHQRKLALKPSAERLLGLPPETQDALKTWVLSHKRQLEAQFPEIVDIHGGIKPSTAGAFIAYCPVDIVAPYANDDVDKMLALLGILLKEVKERGMMPAYDREREVMPLFLQNEREGIRTDLTQLREDKDKYEAGQNKADAWLRKQLKAPGLDFNKDAAVAAALKKVDEVTQWSVTATGRDSVSKKNLKLVHFRHPNIASVYSYRQRCATILETFVRPWILRTAPDGFMRTSWNQVRQPKGGTRTGRPSSDHPNFLNMPKKFKEDDMSQYRYPEFLGVPELPKVRDYILPDEKGHVFGRRDYNQQELRILGHFEEGAPGGGALMAAYLANPRLDVHNYLMLKIINELGIDIDRYVTKTLNFGYIYGQGLPSLAEKMDKSLEEVKVFRNAQMEALPGLKALSEDLKAISRRGEPIRTWGGREYYVEPSILFHGRYIDFTYKLLNYLIQGSAADITKQSLINYSKVRKEGRFALTVYDENNMSVPFKALKPEMLRMRGAMMGVKLDVPLLSDGEWGYKLGTLEALKEPPPDLSAWGIKNFKG